MFETDQRWNRRVVLWALGLQLLLAVVQAILLGAHFGTRAGSAFSFIGFCVSLLGILSSTIYLIFLRVKLLRPSPVFFINTFLSICWIGLTALFAASVHSSCSSSSGRSGHCGPFAGYLVVNLISAIINVWVTVLALMAWVKFARQRRDARLQESAEMRERDPNDVPERVTYG